MKNSKNDNFTLIGNDSPFGNLPTAAEAERMEAAAPEGDAFAENAVADLALAKMQNEQAAKVAPSRKGRRNGFRVAMIAACIAVFLLGTLVAVAKIGFDVRFTDLLGMKEPAKELTESWYEIGQTKEVDGVEVTIVDAFGDSNNQWAELKTNLKFADAVPDGFVSANDVLFPGSIGKPHAEFTNPDSDVFYHNYGCICTPFARDGYLWYILYFFSLELPINNGYFTLTFDLTVGDDATAKAFEFRWNSKYDAREEVIVVNTPVGDVTVTEVRISPTCLTVYAKRPSAEETSFRIDSITLADGTVYPAKTTIFYGLAGGSWTEGWTEGPNPEGAAAFARYLLLPGHSFDTPNEMTSMIPAGEITAITVDGVTIPIR